MLSQSPKKTTQFQNDLPPINKQSTFNLNQQRPPIRQQSILQSQKTLKPQSNLYTRNPTLSNSLHQSADNLQNSLILGSARKRRENTVSILDRSRKESSKGKDGNQKDSKNDMSEAESESLEESDKNKTDSSSSMSNFIQRRNPNGTNRKSTLFVAKQQTQTEKKQSLDDLKGMRRKNVVPIVMNQLQDFTTLKRIFDIDVTDEKFEERRVVMLKSMLRMKEKENILLRELIKRKENAFLRCSELCAFLTQILSNDYLEKRKHNIGEPLGVQLSRKDTRKIQTSLAWKEIIHETATNNVEKRILMEMGQIMSLPSLSKSPEDIKTLRKTVVTRICEQDETFARQYLLSLMKEIKVINKRDKKLKLYQDSQKDAFEVINQQFLTINSFRSHHNHSQNQNILNQTIDVNKNNPSRLNHSSQSPYPKGIISINNHRDHSSHGTPQIKIENQSQTLNKTIDVQSLKYFNFETVMRLETDLYLLFRSLIKFLRNDNFLEYYQHLIHLKTAIRDTIQSLFDFGLVLGNQERFAQVKQQVDFFNGINKYLLKGEVQGVKRGSAKAEEQSVMASIRRKVYLNQKRINKILRKSDSKNADYLSKKLNKIRANEMKMQIQLLGLQTELDLQKNCNIQIEQRLNTIDEYSLKKFHKLQIQLKQKVFDQLRFAQERSTQKNFIIELQNTLSNIFKYERFLNGEDEYQQRINGQKQRLISPKQTPIEPENQFEKTNKQILNQISKLKSYLVDFDRMMNDVCQSSQDDSKV